MSRLLRSLLSIVKPRLCHGSNGEIQHMGNDINVPYIKLCAVVHVNKYPGLPLYLYIFHEIYEIYLYRYMCFNEIYLYRYMCFNEIYLYSCMCFNEIYLYRYMCFNEIYIIIVCISLLLSKRPISG